MKTAFFLGVGVTRILVFLASVFFCLELLAGVSVRVGFLPVANLVYQLDCVSEVLGHCSRGTYQELWRREFLKEEPDSELVREWGLLTGRYGTELELKSDPSNAADGRHESVVLSTKIRVASFQATGLEDYFSRLDLVVSPKDRSRFESIVRHFYPRFERWWKSTAALKGGAFAKRTEKLLKSPAIRSQLIRYARFYQTDLPDRYEIRFNLFYRPDLLKEATSGEQIENYSVAEFLPTEEPKDRIDVVIHELCHFFFDSASEKDFASLLAQFKNDNRLEAKAAYNLMNETLATVFGNGMINRITMKKEAWERFLAKERSFYNDDNIDKAARTVLPWMDAWLTAGKTLYAPDFEKDYVSTLEKNFGKSLTAPRLLLNELALIADSKYGHSFRTQVHRSLRASSMYTSEGNWTDDRMLQTYNENKTISALIIIHPDNLIQLQKKNILPQPDYDRLKNSVATSKQALYAFNRTPTTPSYIVTAPTYETALQLLEKLATLKEGFEGPLSGPL